MERIQEGGRRCCRIESDSWMGMGLMWMALSKKARSRETIEGGLGGYDGMLACWIGEGIWRMTDAVG